MNTKFYCVTQCYAVFTEKRVTTAAEGREWKREITKGMESRLKTSYFIQDGCSDCNYMRCTR
jgi:hypothetical protein